MVLFIWKFKKQLQVLCFREFIRNTCDGTHALTTENAIVTGAAIIVKAKLVDCFIKTLFPCHIRANGRCMNDRGNGTGSIHGGSWLLSYAK